jgi:hypothetical protein
MRKIIAALFAIALMAGSASASDDLDVMRTVWHFVAAINNGDVKTALGDCAAQSSIIDEFPPYLWQGARDVLIGQTISTPTARKTA